MSFHKAIKSSPNIDRQSSRSPQKNDQRLDKMITITKLLQITSLKLCVYLRVCFLCAQFNHILQLQLVHIILLVGTPPQPQLERCNHPICCPYNLAWSLHSMPSWEMCDRHLSVHHLDLDPTTTSALCRDSSGPARQIVLYSPGRFNCSVWRSWWTLVDNEVIRRRMGTCSALLLSIKCKTWETIRRTEPQ